VERAAHGDRDAFDLLMSDTLDRLYAVARLILRDADLAEDAVQEQDWALAGARLDEVGLCQLQADDCRSLLPLGAKAAGVGGLDCDLEIVTVWPDAGAAAPEVIFERVAERRCELLRGAQVSDRKALALSDRGVVGRASGLS